MELSQSLHPQFLIENLAFLSKLLIDDQDFRHPSVRNQTRHEIQSLASSLNLSVPTQNRIKEVEATLAESQEIVSWLNQELLAECHERTRLAYALIRLEKILSAESSSALKPQSLWTRARDLSQEISSLSLSKNPSWIELVIFRWKLNPLYRESEYLAKVLDQS